MKKIIAVDIDGILTYDIEGHDYEKRTANKENIKIVNSLYEKYIIILYTSRDCVDKYITVNWLRENKVNYHDIIFNKPKFDYMIDDKAFNNMTQLINRI